MRLARLLTDSFLVKLLFVDITQFSGTCRTHHCWFKCVLILKAQGEPMWNRFTNRFINFRLLHKRTVKKSAHEKDHNYEPFGRNRSINKKVHINRFTNLLATTDVLGHVLWTFFEKVHNYEPFCKGFKNRLIIIGLILNRFINRKGFIIKEKAYECQVAGRFKSLSALRQVPVRQMLQKFPEFVKFSCSLSKKSFLLQKKVKSWRESSLEMFWLKVVFFLVVLDVCWVVQKQCGEL